MVKTPSSAGARLPSLIAKLTAGNLIYLAAQFVVFIFLAQLVEPSAVGTFSWALAIASPIFTLADMRTQQIQLSTPSEIYPYKVFWRQRVFLMLLVGLLLTVLGPFLARDAEGLRIFWGVIALRTVEGLLGVPIGEKLRAERMASVARLQVVRSAAYVVPFVSILLVTRRVDLALAGASLALFIPVLLAHASIPSSVRGEAPWRRVLKLSREALPIGLGFFIGSLTVNAPRIVLESFWGAVELAAFAAVAYVIVVINQVVDSINQGVMPRMALLWREDRLKELRRMTLLILFAIAGVGVTGTFGALMFGNQLLGLVFGEFYADSGDIMAAMLAASAIMHLAQALRNMLIAGGMRRGVLVVSAANFFTSIVFVVLLVPRHAGVGAALGLASGQVISLASYAFLSVAAMKRAMPRQGVSS